MIKLSFSIFFIVLSFLTLSQNWGAVNGGLFKKQTERVLFDSVHNELLVSGKFIRNIGNTYVRGICRWNGVRWDSLSSGVNTHDILNTYPNGMALTCIPYQGKLLVGGMFQSIGGINATSLALWDGNRWDSLPKNAFRFKDDPIQVSGFLKKDNLLYITGNFDTIAGQPATGIATWDGTNYHPILLPIDPDFIGTTSIVEFQNDIYIAGNKGDILKYDGISWVSTTGGGFIGPYAGARQLIVYNNELYAAGYFEMGLGNPGNNVIKWDGSQWHDVGFGTMGAYIEINKMLVYHNKLWVFGYFSKVANAFTSNVASYDGVTWCGLKDTLDNAIASATVYNDTIYIGGGFWTANSDSLHFLAKLKNENLYNQCINVGLHELLSNNEITVYPNPANSILNISDEQNQLQNAIIQIKNPLGQNVYSSSFSNQIDISTLSAGIYFLTIENKYNKKMVKFAKN
ncbi:MAG: T9SS type A sorting domain-containing protein [Bacteroidetes bacterium]|nr:T9SS type A sorting domain-containing protein [Bacteroidota bacterium]